MKAVVRGKGALGWLVDGCCRTVRHGLRVGSLEVLLKGKVSINVLLVLKGSGERY